MKKLLTIIGIICSLTAFGQTAQDYFIKGNEEINFNTQNYANAIEYYDEAIKLDSDFVDAYFYRGYSKRQINDLKGAIADYDKAIELKPDFVDVFTFRAQVKSDLKDSIGAFSDYHKAIKLYDQVIKLKPDSANAFTDRGFVKWKSNDWKGAIQDFDFAIKLDPKNAQNYRLRGQIKLSKPQLKKEACSDFLKAKELGDRQAVELAERNCKNQIK
jgi:tetratricopeptide (TPR) repeat protein